MANQYSFSNKTGHIWTVFLIYTILYFIIAGVLQKQEYTWLLLDALSFIVSIRLLIIHKFPNPNGIIVALIISLIYLVYALVDFSPFQLFMIALVFLSSAASYSVFSIYKENALQWVQHTSIIEVVKSISIGILVGASLGYINYLLMKANNPMVPTNILKAFVFSLSPATIEEISFRSVFYAFTLSSYKGRLEGKFTTFTCWFMMIVPHILPHMSIDPNMDVMELIISWLVILVLYILIFGLAFAILQKKRDILSAMIAHGLVDFIRFVLFGLPM